MYNSANCGESQYLLGVKDVLQNVKRDQDFWRKFYGPNIGYVEEQYEIYKDDPNAVDPTLKEMFDQYGAPKWMDRREEDSHATSGMTVDNVRKLTSAMRYVDAIRRFGHLEADVYADRKSTRLNSSHVAISYAVF